MKLENPNLFRNACFVAGKWLQSLDGRTMEVVNPATGQTLGRVPLAGRPEAAMAVAAAYQAWGPWKGLTAAVRAGHIRKWRDLIIANTRDLSVILTQEQGKPLAEARREINQGCSYLAWYAEECRRAYGKVVPPNAPGRRCLTMLQSVGVVGVITPWNNPFSMILRKAAPALAAGCTLVVKPAPQTPYSALALGALAEAAGLPAGVFNVVTGDAEDIGAELTGDPRVRKLSFTGSTAVGKLLMAQCAATVKKVSLELGGNAPLIVFEDADLDMAAAGALGCKFRNSGQACVCANRILVQEGVFAAFMDKLTAMVKNLRLGNGLEIETTQGPLIDEAAVAKVQELVDDALAKGAKAVTGGRRSTLGGWFFEPTVLVGVTQDMRVFREEIFGPVAPVVKFATEEQAVELANDTAYGLASYLYTRDLGRTWRVSEALEYGLVGVNETALASAEIPFGGIKESGLGREGGVEGLLDYMETKYILMGGMGE
jgi:succinate-semialdehyde dehydrogenase/glutarate-semialdehyde dehydrogenase